MNEEAFYFNNKKNKKLFGFMHMPEKNNLDRGFVFCSPTFGEKTKTYRIFVNFARLLALNGYYVLRFDYMGEGDSEGDFEQADIETRISDIKQAISMFQERTCVNKVGLLGLRIGATFAVLTANDNRIDSLVLWEPILNIKDYLHNFLRGNLSNQLLVHKKILINRDQLIAKILANEKIEVDGWHISKSLWEQSNDINFYGTIKEIQVPMIIVNMLEKSVLSPLENYVDKKKQHIDFETVKPEFAWNEIKYYNPNPKEIFEKSLHWIKNHYK